MENPRKKNEKNGVDDVLLSPLQKRKQSKGNKVRGNGGLTYLCCWAWRSVCRERWKETQEGKRCSLGCGNNDPTVTRFCTEIVPQSFPKNEERASPYVKNGQ